MKLIPCSLGKMKDTTGVMRGRERGENRAEIRRIEITRLPGRRIGRGRKVPQQEGGLRKGG